MMVVVLSLALVVGATVVDIGTVTLVVMLPGEVEALKKTVVWVLRNGSVVVEAGIISVVFGPVAGEGLPVVPITMVVFTETVVLSLGGELGEGITVVAKVEFVPLPGEVGSGWLVVMETVPATPVLGLIGTSVVTFMLVLLVVNSGVVAFGDTVAVEFSVGNEVGLCGPVTAPGVVGVVEKAVVAPVWAECAETVVVRFWVDSNMRAVNTQRKSSKHQIIL